MRALILTTTINLTNYKPKNHIHYKNSASLIKSLKEKPLPLDIDTLMFSGGHGNANPATLNEISEIEVNKLTKYIKDHNQHKVKNIVADCCDSASFIPHFKDMLDKTGVMYCNLSDGRQHNIINLFNNYPKYRQFSLGMGLFNLISLMFDVDKCVNINRVTYPAIYLKAQNTLYYHGDADQAIIENLQGNGIKIVKLNNVNEYLDKLLVSNTPFTEEADRLASNNQKTNDWRKLRQRNGKNKNSLSDNNLLKKLNSMFEVHFKDKSTITTKEYVSILYPIARRYARKDSDPIQILAEAACMYILENTKDKFVKEYYTKIKLELNQLRSSAFVATQKTLLPRSALLGTLTGLALYAGRAISVVVPWSFVGLASIIATGIQFVRSYAHQQLKISGLSEYHQLKSKQLSEKPQARLQAFLDGTQNTLFQRAKSYLMYRDWRYMRDYYAGLGAVENNDKNLITLVKKSLKP